MKKWERSEISQEVVLKEMLRNTFVIKGIDSFTR